MLWPPDRVEITEAMLHAGEAALLKWFSQNHISANEELNIPEREDAQVLVGMIFASMMLCKELS
jgi:hypothetical protein